MSFVFNLLGFFVFPQQPLSGFWAEQFLLLDIQDAEPVDEPLDSDIDVLVKEESVDDPLDSTQDILEELPEKILKKPARKRPTQKIKEIKGTSRTKKPNPYH
uniref:Uncharacterized protein n=1 Tax=Cacopsylla melanoneura TaxID=428564 RepID=A0A8D8LV77_9HEMI